MIIITDEALQKSMFYQKSFFLSAFHNFCIDTMTSISKVINKKI